MRAPPTAFGPGSPGNILAIAYLSFITSSWHSLHKLFSLIFDKIILAAFIRITGSSALQEEMGLIFHLHVLFNCYTEKQITLFIYNLKWRAIADDTQMYRLSIHSRRQHLSHLKIWFREGSRMHSLFSWIEACKFESVIIRSPWLLYACNAEVSNSYSLRAISAL